MKQKNQKVFSFAHFLVIAIAIPTSLTIHATEATTRVENSSELFISGHADTLLADTSRVSTLAAYEAVEAAAGGAFLGRDVLVLLRDHDKLRFHRLSRPKAPVKPLPALPFRIANAAIPREGQGDRMLLLRDEGGDEEFQLYAYAPRQGQTALWPMPKGRASEVLFAPGGKSFVYAHTPAGTSQWDIRYGTFGKTGLAPHFRDSLWFRSEGIWTPADIDSSGRHLLLIRNVASFHNELYRFDKPTLQRLPPLDPSVTISWAKWLESPTDSQNGQVVLLADGPKEYAALYTWRPGDTLRPISPPCDCEVEAAALIPNSHRVVFALNRQATSELFIADIDSGWVKPLPGIPQGVLAHMQIDATGHRLLLLITHFGTPGDLYLHDLQKHTTTLWMRAPGLAKLPKPRFALALPRYLEVTPPDPLPQPQTQIPYWLIAPHPLAPQGKIAAATPKPTALLLHIHGGPEMQARPGWDPLDRYLEEQWGVAVVYPNLRGSSGYGRAYLAADDQGRRPKVLRDLSEVLRNALVTVSPTSNQPLQHLPVAIEGRSYGGFVAQAAALDFGSQLQSAIATVGISDFPAFLAGTRGYRQDLRRMEYGDERNTTQRPWLDSISPLHRMGTLAIPLLLIHGRNDPRVPFAQSESVFVALTNRQAPALLLAQQEEGHAARGRRARLAQMLLSARFLLRTLGL